MQARVVILGAGIGRPDELAAQRSPKCSAAGTPPRLRAIEALAAEKQHFGPSRKARWFGGA